MATSLRQYRIDEAEFAVDPGFTDDSINIFTGQPPDLAKTSFVITRARPDTPDVMAYATEQLQNFETNFPEYRLSSARDREVAGVKCREVAFSWRADRGLLHQWQLYVPAGTTILIATFTALEQITEAHRQAVTAFVQSLRLV